MHTDLQQRVAAGCCSTRSCRWLMVGDDDPTVHTATWRDGESVGWFLLLLSLVLPSPVWSGACAGSNRRTHFCFVSGLFCFVLPKGADPPALPPETTNARGLFCFLFFLLCYVSLYFSIDWCSTSVRWSTFEICCMFGVLLLLRAREHGPWQVLFFFSFVCIVFVNGCFMWLIEWLLLPLSCPIDTNTTMLTLACTFSPNQQKENG